MEKHDAEACECSICAGNGKFEHVFEKPQIFWLSFADPDKELGKQFLGVIITEARSLKEAIRKTKRAGINPGGEVLSVNKDADKCSYDPKYVDRLLDYDTLMDTGLGEEIRRTPEGIKKGWRDG